jgi:prepilin-type processing-associated H-X9-DG protein
MGLGLRMYTQDYDERMPPAYVVVTDNNWKYPNGSTESTRAWYLLIYPYIKNYQVYNCPSADSALRYKGGYEFTTFPYSYNYAKPYPGDCGTVYNCGVSMGSPGGAGASLAAIEDPSGTIFVVDGSTAITQFYKTRMPTEADVMASGVKYADYYARSVRARHLGTIGTLFVDGHVKAMPWKTILGGVNASTVKYWTTAADPTVN